MQIFKYFPLFTVILVVYFACFGLDIVVATPIPNTEEQAHVPEVHINVSSDDLSLIIESPVDPQFYTTEVAITQRVILLPSCNGTMPPGTLCHSTCIMTLPKNKTRCRQGQVYLNGRCRHVW